ncbi:hypothetical protein BKA66DRAFT_598907 [Pyrenochaeta sp. MPI-SDFR-AT-0127]|nr:hypothetical protein BKA66DRAFT_598907 [Pyrenochaeta sp. MPI-SDFR-AT-0127]
MVATTPAVVSDGFQQNIPVIRPEAEAREARPALKRGSGPNRGVCWEVAKDSLNSSCCDHTVRLLTRSDVQNSKPEFVARSMSLGRRRYEGQAENRLPYLQSPQDRACTQCRHTGRQCRGYKLDAIFLPYSAQPRSKSSEKPISPLNPPNINSAARVIGHNNTGIGPRQVQSCQISRPIDAASSNEFTAVLVSCFAPKARKNMSSFDTSTNQVCDNGDYVWQLEVLINIVLGSDWF